VNAGQTAGPPLARLSLPLPRPVSVCLPALFLSDKALWTQFGEVHNVIIPRPPPPGQPEPPGVGKVIVEFADVEGAVKAQRALHGRKFGGRPVVASYVTEDAYAAGDL
jgi:hypothetical protein